MLYAQKKDVSFCGKVNSVSREYCISFKPMSVTVPQIGPVESQEKRVTLSTFNTLDICVTIKLMDHKAVKLKLEIWLLAWTENRKMQPSQNLHLILN